MKSLHSTNAYESHAAQKSSPLGSRVSEKEPTDLWNQAIVYQHGSVPQRARRSAIPSYDLNTPFLGRRPANVRYATQWGRTLIGKSDAVLSDGSLARFAGRINLIFTSPPFPLNRKKRYGNETGESYIQWLCAFGPLFKKMLAPNGSIVIEMGNSWEPGAPVMSTLAIASLQNASSTKRRH